MKKILVTTDFSAASKTGLRFAIQLATQSETELVFFHCFQALIPTSVLKERIEVSLERQGKEFLHKLEKMVASVHKSMKAPAGKHHCVVVESLDPTAAMLDYAAKHQFDYICMSTHGAGAIRKLVGTTTGSVIQRSSIPVLVVPSTYRRQPLKKILYASDLAQFDKEMPRVSNFAASVDAGIDVAHFYYPGEISLEPAVLEQMWRAKYPAIDRVYLQQHQVERKFEKQLDRLVSKNKPSLLVFFTHTNKTWYDKLFGKSLSEAVSFVTRVPMLVFRKS